MSQSQSSSHATRDCPACGKSVDKKRFGQHLRETHADYAWTPQQLQDNDLHVCCGQAFLGSRGLARHQSSDSGSCKQDTTVPASTAAPVFPAPQAPPTTSPLPLDARYERLLTLPTSALPLPVNVLPHFLSTCDRLAEAYIAQPTEENLLNILAFPKEAVIPAFRRKSAEEIRARFAAYPSGEVPQPHKKPIKKPSIAKAAENAVSKGLIGRASRILCEDSSVLEATEPVIEALRALHPTGKNNPFGNALGPANSTSTSHKAVVTEVRKMARDVAPGISGWSRHLFLTAFRKDSRFSSFFLTLLSQIHKGTAPGRRFLCASSLTPLDKKPGVRPIAVGEMFYRIAGKVLLKREFKRSMLLPCQFGVMSPGGVEPIIRAWQRAREGTLPLRYTTATSLDCKNAFNCIDRERIATSLRNYGPAFYRMAKWAYNDPSPLYIRTPTGIQKLQSSQGVRQGNPLGPFLFSVAFRDFLSHLQSELGDRALIKAYLDDIAGLSVGSILETCKEIFEEDPGLNISLNITKSEESDILSHDVSIEPLGSYIGPQPDLFLKNKIDLLLQDLRRLDGIASHHAFLILTDSLQLRLRHLQRTLPPSPLLAFEWERLDAGIRRTVLSWRGRRQGEEHLDRTIIHLPSRFNGLGLLSHVDCHRHAYEAAQESSDFELTLLLAPQTPTATLQERKDLLVSQKFRCFPDFIKQKEELEAGLSPAERLQWTDQHSKLASAWTTTIPSNKFYTLSPQEMAMALSYKTLKPGALVVCKYCAEENVLGHDEVCLRRDSLKTARHEYIKRAIRRSLETVPDTTIHLEPRVRSTSGKRVLRTDLKIIGPASFGQHQSDYDVSLVTLFAKSVQQRSRVRLATLTDQESTQHAIDKMLDERAEKKSRKYQNIVRGAFHPFILSLGGGTISTSTKKILEFWSGEDILGKYKYSLLCRSLAMSLLRAKAKFFTL